MIFLGSVADGRAGMPRLSDFAPPHDGPPEALYLVSAFGGLCTAHAAEFHLWGTLSMTTAP